jgi:hypothetical protein
MNGPAWTGEYTSLPTVDPTWDLAASGDFNGDGQTDLLWQHLPTGERAIWFMHGAVYEGQHAFLPQVDPAWRIAGAADFNADGSPDILWQHLHTGQRVLWFMSGPTYEGQHAYLPQVEPAWRIAGVGDFNADGSPDILWQHLAHGSARHLVHERSGLGGWLRVSPAGRPCLADHGRVRHAGRPGAHRDRHQCGVGS